MKTLTPPVSTVIVSVYKDADALKLILDSLNRQTISNFEVIVSEDGQSQEIGSLSNDFRRFDFSIQHLTHEDRGFRKNIALNRAIKASHADHIIFIDGDCVPHTGFVEAHQVFTMPGTACTGRRLELGEKISASLRSGRMSLKRLTGRLSYLALIPSLQNDSAKNIECGIYSRTLFKLSKNRSIRLLGCNFSCHKTDLIKINGFNEDYLAAGIGEDSDIDWRLSAAGVKIKNVKFLAIQYHLYHPRLYNPSKENKTILETTRKLQLVSCKNGLKK